MEPVLSNGDLICLRLFFQSGSRIDQAMNVLYYRLGGLTGAPTDIYDGLAIAAETLYEAWAQDWQDFASEDARMQYASVTRVFPLPRSVTVNHVPAIPVAGLVEGDSLPMQDAVTILKKTNFGTRWGMGRMFVSGIPEANAEEGLITGAGIATLLNLIAQVSTLVVVTGEGYSFTLTPVLLRGPEDNPVSITDIERGQLSDTIIKTQRRRRPGKGS